MSLSINVFIFAIYIGSALAIYHSIRFRGAYKTIIFILGLFIVTAGIENINVIFGGYYYPSGGITIWFYNCPLWVPLGWYFIIYCSNFVSHSLIGKGKGSLPLVGIGTNLENGIDKSFIKLTALRALFAAYLSVLVDYIMDPVGANLGNRWWIWKINNIYVHGIPAGNYLGWVLVIFWTLLLYELLIAWSSAKNTKPLITSALWSGLSFASMMIAGTILMAFTFLFGMKGIRTENGTVLDITITPARFEQLLITMVVIIITIGLLLGASFVPDKKLESPPTAKILYLLPSIVILGFWAAMEVIGLFTGSLFVAIGILYCVPLFWVHIYFIKKTYKGEGEAK